VALVALLRGVNVGGRRPFRPATFVDQLRHLDAVNIGATGVFVIKRPVSRTQLRAELAARLPFDAEVMICAGRELIGLLSHPAFAKYRAGPDDVRFVSILSRRPRSMPRLPITMPSHGKWLVKIIACEGRFALGVYRRHMKVIGYLGALDRTFGAVATTRSLNTIEAIAKVLNSETARQ
jgi:uncharacterized protein (DUF1697 family)